MEKETLSVFWFRRDLRLSDNVGFYEALRRENIVIPLFIFDENILEQLHNKTDKRVAFIHHVLQNIQLELTKIGRSLLVLKGKPKAIFEQLTAQYNLNKVYVNDDYEPYAIKRDSEIEAYLKNKNVDFLRFKDQVIFEKSEIMKSDNTPYTIFTPYANIWKQKINHQTIECVPSEQLLKNCIKASFNFPSLADIGFKTAENIFWLPEPNEKIIENYHNTRNIPSLQGTTNLSTHLRFGTVSIRALVKKAIILNEKWLNELIWREFFMMILFHHPRVVNECFKTQYHRIAWRNNEIEFEKWCKGETGYPIVDAGMRELNTTGLMHNRVRMIVASFLTKHLLIDWRWGENYFAEKLLDYDVSANNGNWQWVAGCGCDAAPYFRIFNPYEQAKQFDPNLIYIKKWIPNLNELDYPKPIVEHKFARERVLTVFKTTLQYG